MSGNKRLVFFVAFICVMLPVGLGLASPTVEIVSPREGQIVPAGETVTVEVRMYNYPDPEARAWDQMDYFALTLDGDRRGPQPFRDFTEEELQFTWEDGVAEIAYQWQVPDVSPGEYELRVVVYVRLVERYRATQRIRVGPPPPFKLAFVEPDEGAELRLDEPVDLKLTAEGLSEREPDDHDLVTVSLRRADDQQRYSVLEEPLTQVGFEWTDREAGEARITCQFMVPEVLGEELVEPEEHVMLSAELRWEGRQAVTDEREVQLTHRRPLITATREARAFYTDSCAGPVVALPGLPLWVRIRLEVHDQVPAIILQEAVPEGWGVPEEAQVSSGARVVQLSCDNDGASRACWMLIPEEKTFPAGTEITIVHSLLVPADAREGAVSLSGSLQTIGANGEVEECNSGEVAVEVSHRLPVLVAVARLDHVLMQVEPDTFEIDDVLSLLEQRYTIGEEQYELAEGYIGQVLPGAKARLTLQDFLQVAAYYASGEPVVQCPDPEQD